MPVMSAASAFIDKQSSSTQIGIVAFSSFGEIIQAPTTDQEALQNAIESLMLGRRTAIGSGILESIDAIAQVDKNIPPSLSDSSTGAEPTPVPKGDYAPDIIVLLTDGVSNAGPSPLDAAQQAADRGVRIYTIGFGTEAGGDFSVCDMRFRGNERLGSNGQFGGGFSLVKSTDMTSSPH